MGPVRRFPTVASCLALCGACSLGEADLDAFRATATGPQKLSAVVRDTSRDHALRARAALDLLDLERSDVDGRALLFADLAALDGEGRAAIVPTFKDGLLERMRTARSKLPSKAAVQAKDTGVRLLAMVGPKERALLGSELLSWICEDVELRADRGQSSLEAVANALGDESAMTLTAELTNALSPNAMKRIASIVDEKARGPARARAAERLVSYERAFRASARDSGALFEVVLPALGLFVDQPSVRARLLEIARMQAPGARERSRALDLLAGRATSAELDALLELALSESEAPELRELALRRAGETHSQETLPALLSIMTHRDHHSLRQTAAELALAIGGREVCPSFFRNLPHHWKATYAKREIDAYSERLVGFEPNIPLLMYLGERMHSVFWWHRILALRYFAARGTAEDAWRIRQHLNDAHLVVGEGWPSGYTVGQEANAALAILLERFHTASAAKRSSKARPEELSRTRPSKASGSPPSE